MKKSIILAIAIAAVLALVGCNKVKLEGTRWKSDDLTDFFLVFNSPQKVSLKIDSHTESGEYTISGNKVTITFEGETLKGTISGNKLSLLKNDNIMTFTKLSGEVAASVETTAMPSQSYVSKWRNANDPPDELTILEIGSNTIKFEWDIFGTGVAIGTAKIENGKIVFTTDAYFSGTFEFVENGILATIDKSTHMYIKTGLLYNFTIKDFHYDLNNMDEMIIAVVNALQAQDAPTLNRLVHPDYGVAILTGNALQFPHFRDRISFLDDLEGIGWTMGTLPNITYRVRHEELPTFDYIESTWNKPTGIYCQPSNDPNIWRGSLSGLIEMLAEYDYELPPETKKKAQKFDVNKDLYTILAINHEDWKVIRFTLTLIDDRLYLTLIDMYYAG
jgi:hypothetical protein